MSRARAYAKINLALVVGPLRVDGKHEVVTVLQRIDLHDEISLERGESLAVAGFAEDTIVRAGLEALADAAGVEPCWHVHIEKRIPVAAGLGGGSADAATALRLANGTLDLPLPRDDLHDIAARLGADVPFFLGDGAQLATGDGTVLQRIELPLDYWILIVVPDDARKESTRDVYDAFDDRDVASGYTERAAALREALTAVERARDLAGLPPNDLASSPLASQLVHAGAFRADVSGAGPALYGLFESEDDASRAADALAHVGRTLVTRPAEAGDRPRVAR
jgi:4-diphosphocytidyl-2-C-methyl-D-erythritol kinase